MANKTTSLEVTTRTPAHSREARRLRRSGRVPGVIYGGGEDPISFDVDARELRLALAAAGAVLDVRIDGGASTSAVLKDSQRDVVLGHTTHVDLLRVRLDRPIEAVVALELTGVDDAPGVRVGGGVLEQITRELRIEALPTAIPESIVHDVSEMQISETLTLASIKAPSGVTLLDDPDETTIAILSPPRVAVESDEIEAETQLVGDDDGGADADAESADDADESSD